MEIHPKMFTPIELSSIGVRFSPFFASQHRGGATQNKSKSDLIILHSIHVGWNIILVSKFNPQTPPPQNIYSN